MTIRTAHLLLLALLVAAPARAQAPADSAATDTTAAKPAAPVRVPRASWLSDRLPLRTGDLVTIVVDEATAATEHVSNVVTGNRSTRADLNAGIGADAQIGPNKSFGTGVNSSSNDTGDSGHKGNFTSVLTARVVDLDEHGLAKISGSKKVTIDGRTQEVTLTGTIRAEDVDGHNQVRSDHVADVVLTYKGKKVAPRTGFLGSLLGMVWP